MLLTLTLVGAPVAAQMVVNQPDPKAISQRGLSGRRAPSFALPDTKMIQYDILDYRGRWLILEYFKTDCPHCRDLTKVLDALKTRLGARVAMLSIVVPPDNTATVGKYIAETKTSIPVLFDTGQTAMWYFKATPQRPSFDSPHVFAINPQGMIVRDWNQSDTEAAGFAAQVEATVGGGSQKK